jgi:hypothetical protein
LKRSSFLIHASTCDSIIIIVVVLFLEKYLPADEMDVAPLTALLEYFQSSDWQIALHSFVDEKCALFQGDDFQHCHFAVWRVNISLS